MEDDDEALWYSWHSEGSGSDDDEAMMNEYSQIGKENPHIVRQIKKWVEEGEIDSCEHPIALLILKEGMFKFPMLKDLSLISLSVIAHL